MVNRWQRLPFHLQVTLILIAVSGIVTLGGAELLRHLETRFLHDNALSHSRNTLAMISAGALDPLITEDAPLLETVATSAGRLDPDLSEISIRNEEDRVLVHWLQPGAAVDPKTAFILQAPVSLEGETFGVIEARWDMRRRLDAIDSHITGIRTTLAIATLGLTLLVFLILRWLVIHPLRHLHIALQRLSAHGEVPDLKAARTSSDLAQLAQAIDALAVAKRDLVAARDEALAGSRAKSVFLATLSHELRTPLNAVLGMIDLVLNDEELPPQQAEYLRLAHTAALEQLRLLSDLLDFTALDSGRVRLHVTAFDLPQCLDEIAARHRPVAAEKSLAFQLDLADNLARTWQTDRGRLIALVSALLDNAIKFTRHGFVRLSAATPTPDRLEIEVADSGIGIPADTAALIFDPFRQAEHGSTRRYGGLGLGLAIAIRTARAIGAELELIESHDHGSRFRITLHPAALSASNTPASTYALAA